jgi:hypothetical protein
VIVLAVVAGVVAFSSPTLREPFDQKRAADETFRSFSSGLIRSDYERSYSLTAKEFREGTPFDDFVAANKKLRAENGSLKSVEISNYRLDRYRDRPWIAKYEVAFVFERKTEMFNCELRSNEHKWEIFGCNLESY